MQTKTISSTQAQNNFGQIIDAVVQNRTRYVIKRRNVSQAILLSLSDFERLLKDASEREKVSEVIREISPAYDLGEPIESSA